MSRRTCCWGLFLAALSVLVVAAPLAAEERPESNVWRALTLNDYNTRVVLLGTSVLGACSGVVGAHLFLRRRALLGDVVSHAALPGVCLAFLIGEALWPGEGKSLGVLMTGAAISAVCGVICLEGIRRTRRLAEDAALAIVLSLFFGLGAALLTVIQGLSTGSAAGLADFLFGKPAGLLMTDVILIGISSTFVLAVCGLLWKELIVVSFDATFAQTQGWPIRTLDLVLVGLVTAVTVIGMQCVGLLLVVALLIIPPAAARFWTDRIGSLALFSGAIGALSAACGVVLSAALPRLATGALIVLCATATFVVSLLFGVQRGLVGRWRKLRQAKARSGRHDLLRACFELMERRLQEQPAAAGDATAVSWTTAEVEAMRHWTPGRLPESFQAALREGLIRTDAEGKYHLTGEGLREAQAAARKHRLWELYLIRFAGRHPIDVDRDADIAEHVLDPRILEELENLLPREQTGPRVPHNPHEVGEY
jgi:manganese/zinc/iron transport system permease protein